MDYESELKAITENLQKSILQTNLLIKSCPYGKLSFEKRNNKLILENYYYKDGKRKREYLTKDADKTILLLRKTMLERKEKLLAKDLSVLQNALTKLQGFNAYDEIIRIKSTFPGISDNMIEEALKFNNADEWANEDFEQSDYKVEEKRHITSKGLKVRSKSEALIVEQFYDYDLPFRYEQVIHIRATTLAPDFTIKRADGKIFIWEHEGLTSQKSYTDWQLRKHQLYDSIGIVPWDNLIVTYDDANGNIDLRIVKSEIENKLLI